MARGGFLKLFTTTCIYNHWHTVHVYELFHLNLHDFMALYTDDNFRAVNRTIYNKHHSDVCTMLPVQLKQPQLATLHVYNNCKWKLKLSLFEEISSALYNNWHVVIFSTCIAS